MGENRNEKKCDSSISLSLERRRRGTDERRKRDVSLAPYLGPIHAKFRGDGLTTTFLQGLSSLGERSKIKYELTWAKNALSCCPLKERCCTINLAVVAFSGDEKIRRTLLKRKRDEIERSNVG